MVPKFQQPKRITKIKIKTKTKPKTRIIHEFEHGQRTPNEGINQRYLKNWAGVADEISFGRT